MDALERCAAGISKVYKKIKGKFIRELFIFIFMSYLSDGKRRLPLYSAAEAHFNLSRMISNCYELYAFDKLPDDEKITGDNNGILNVL